MPSKAKKYWVWRIVGNSGAVIENLPDDGPDMPRFFTGQRLAGEFPSNAVLRFSERFPDKRKLFDVVSNLESVPTVSENFKQVLESLSADNCEFLPVVILDHKGKIASRSHYLLNLLGSEEAIDMERSTYRINALEKTQISRIKSLVLNQDRISPTARIFRAKTKMDLYFISHEARKALNRRGITGLEVYPADGWNGNEMLPGERD